MGSHVNENKQKKMLQLKKNPTCEKFKKKMSGVMGEQLLFHKIN